MILFKSKCCLMPVDGKSKYIKTVKHFQISVKLSIIFNFRLVKFED